MGPAPGTRPPRPGFRSGLRCARRPPGPCPVVAAHAFPRVDQKRRAIHQIEQITEPARRILTRPTMQFELHPPYRRPGRILVRPRHDTGIHQCVSVPCSLLLDRHAAALPHVACFPVLGVLRRLRPIRHYQSISNLSTDHAPGRHVRWSVRRMVPTFPVVRLTDQAPGSTPAAPPWLRCGPSPRPPGLNATNPAESCPPPRKSPEQRVRTAHQPTSTGLELATREEA